MEPLISVIIPAYNAEKRLDRCLESVCGQDWANLEVLVVDDGSHDNTEQIALAWGKKDPRVHVFHQENQGVAAARNRALEEYKGEWVRFVDADDFLPAGSIRMLYERAQRDSSDLVMAGYEHQVAELIKTWNLADRDDSVTCDEYLAFLNKNANSFFCGVLWNKLFRRELIEQGKIRFISGLSYGEDFCFVCDYLQHAQKISFSKDVVYRYVRHPHSMTVSQTMNSVIHPIRNLKVKWSLYQRMKELYIARDRYDEYRASLWKYMIRVTFNQ